MQPIFFPFTSLTQYDAESILNFFETFTYLSSESADELVISEGDWFQTLWKQKMSIQPLTLSQEEIIPLIASIKSWRTWADANYSKDIKAGYLQSIFKDQPYFTSDTDIFSIRSQIERGTKVEQPILKHTSIINHGYSDSNSQNCLNRSLLFLRLASMTDRENEIVDRHLSSIDGRQANLFAAMQGDEQDIGKIVDKDRYLLSCNKHPKPDRGALMTEQRIRAWFTLFMAKHSYFNKLSYDNKLSDYLSSNIFVTTSRAVIDFLQSVRDKSELMLDIDNFKVHKEKNSTNNYELFQITGQSFT